MKKAILILAITFICSIVNAQTVNYSLDGVSPYVTVPASVTHVPVNFTAIYNNMIVQAMVPSPMSHPWSIKWNGNPITMSGSTVDNMCSPFYEISLIGGIQPGDSIEVDVQISLSYFKIVFVISGGLTTGVQVQEHSNTSIKMYPNPVSDKLNLEFENPTKVEITDISGQTMYSSTVEKEIIETYNYTPGIYFVKTLNASYKFIKQ